MDAQASTIIRTPDQRLRVFISSTLQELAAERAAAAQAVRRLHLAPVLFELGARPHAPRDLYRAYLAQSDVFVGIYWQRYGWVAPDEEFSGLEDEFRLASSKPKLIYVKSPAPEREPRLKQLLDVIRADDHTSYKYFSTLSELKALLENDLALLLSERFVQAAERERGDAGRSSSAAAGAARARSADPALGTPVPVASTSFIGRQPELGELRRLLRRRDVRLVTLTGPGGVGKTRLSIEIGRALERAFPSGVAFVALASITDPALVLTTIAEQLGARERTPRSPLDRLASLLADRRMLLVLDNFEQLVDASADLAALLSACPELSLLVTSRTALRLRGEYELAVHPLDLPTLAAAPAPAAAEAPAVRLFLDRARAINPHFARDAAELSAVEAICRRLDGLPLAIELASARAKVLTAQAMLGRLEDTLRFLNNGARDLPARQQTMRATLDWSYDLLNDAERRLFARLSVFAGGWTLEAAEAVCGCPETEVLDTLTSLIDHSLIQVTTTATGDQRFSMLVTIRDYACARLAATDGAENVARDHANYILAFVDHAAVLMRGSDQQLWRARIGVEQDNIRIALRWLLDAGELPAAARLEMALSVYWWIQGYVAEARRWTDALLAYESVMDQRTRAQAHFAAGLLAAAWEGDYERGLPLLQQSVTAFRALHDSQGAGVAQMALAYVSPSHGGDYQQTEALLLESAADLYQAGDLWAMNVALQSRAEVALAGGDVDRARGLYEDSLELALRQADTRGQAQAFVGLGFVELVAGNLSMAADLLRRGVPLTEQLGNRELLAHALRGLAGVANAHRRDERAAQLLGAAQALADAGGTVDWPVRRQLYTRIERDTRATLAPERFAAAWQAGTGLSSAAAAALALTIERPPHRAPPGTHFRAARAHARPATEHSRA